MPIRPVEILMRAPKSMETSEHNMNQLNKEQHMNDHIVASNQQQVKHNTQQTTKMEKSENNEYRYDAKEKGNGKYKRQGSKGDSKDESKKEGTTASEHSIDILI